MHVHFDIFDLPKGATAMASSKVTPCQAFRFGNKVFAFQFHFEISESNAPMFIKEITPEIVSGKHVQYPPSMIENISCCELNNQVFAKVLEEILHSPESI
jgi:GMP synthase (glutamine-hydrolysing)